MWASKPERTPRLGGMQLYQIAAQTDGTGEQALSRLLCLVMAG
jgi:hypothetical protein